jgi:hypothetical protein
MTKGSVLASINKDMALPAEEENKPITVFRHQTRQIDCKNQHTG